MMRNYYEPERPLGPGRGMRRQRERDARTKRSLAEATVRQNFPRPFWTVLWERVSVTAEIAAERAQLARLLWARYNHYRAHGLTHSEAVLESRHAVKQSGLAKTTGRRRNFVEWLRDQWDALKNTLSGRSAPVGGMA